jgi:hypothetical protein
MSLCGTGIYANDVLCEVIDKLDELQTNALSIKDLALAQLEALRDAALTEVTGYTGIDYNVPSAPGSYTPPVATATEPDYSTLAPTVPTLPDSPTVGAAVAITDPPDLPDAYVVGDADARLITDTDFDNIYTKAKARLARVSVKEERDAQYMASSQGIGLVSTSLLKRLGAAQQKTNERVSEAALQQAVEEATSLREDVKTLHSLNIENWPLKPKLEQDSWATQEELEIRAYEAEQKAKADIYGSATSGLTGLYKAQVDWISGYINSETERFKARLESIRTDLAKEAEKRGWEELELRYNLETAEKETAFAIEKAKLTLNIMTEAEQAIAQLMVGLAQGIFSAADYGLSGQGQQSVNMSIDQDI